MENPPNESKPKKKKVARTALEIATDNAAKSQLHLTDQKPLTKAEVVPEQLNDPQKPEKIIHAEDSFGKSNAPSVPEFTLEELVALGISVVETETTTIVEIPFEAQKKLIESIKGLGFGAAQGLNVILGRIYKLVGFTGKIDMKADPKTLAWTAYQDKRQPAQPEQTAPQTPPPAPDQGQTKPNANVELFYQNVGYAWTALIQQHYQVRFISPLPASLVQLMLNQSDAAAGVEVVNAA